jgi:hypothetical protein
MLTQLVKAVPPLDSFTVSESVPGCHPPGLQRALSLPTYIGHMMEHLHWAPLRKHSVNNGATSSVADLQRTLTATLSQQHSRHGCDQASIKLHNDRQHTP